MNQERERARRIHKMRRRVIFFSIAPIFPILLMLFVTHWIFDETFLDRHLDAVVGEPAQSSDYILLKIELRNGERRLNEARRTVEDRKEAGEDDAKTISLEQPARRLARAAAWTHQRAIVVISDRRPAGFAQSSDAVQLAEALTDVTAAKDRLDAAIEACDTCGNELPALVAAKSRLSATLTRLDRFYETWADAKSRQPAAWMAAVNATIILIVVASGTMILSFRYLLPSKCGGEHYGFLGALRIGAVMFSIAVFAATMLAAFDAVRAESLFAQSLPVIPYRTVTFEFFERTLSLGYGEKGSRLFILCSYASVGLVGAALLGSFTVMSVASRTYIDAPVPNRRREGTALRRMAVVRNMLYLAAALSVAVLLVMGTDFTAAAIMFTDAGSEEETSLARTTIEEMGKVIVQANGIALGLALAAAYLPAAAVLHGPYKAEKKDDGDEGFFSVSGTFGTALRFAAIIAPAVVGGIIKAFGGS
jgi:hypothetical protein